MIMGKSNIFMPAQLLMLNITFYLKDLNVAWKRCYVPVQADK